MVSNIFKLKQILEMYMNDIFKKNQNQFVHSW